MPRVPAEVPVQFSSVAQLFPTLCDPMDCSTSTPGLPVHHQLHESPQLMSIALVMPSNHLLLCHALLLLPSILPSIRVFSNESALRIRWPKYWSFSFSISPPMYSPRAAVIAFDLPSLGPSPSLNQLLWPGRCLFSLARLGS